MAEYIEFSEKTLDDAITTACQKLSVTSDKLDYIVVDHGSAGFLGFNARKAVIKARIKEKTSQTEKVLNEVLNKVQKTEEVKKEQKKSRVLTMDEIEQKAQAAEEARKLNGTASTEEEPKKENAEKKFDKRGGRRDRGDRNDRNSGRKPRRNEGFDKKRRNDKVDTKKHEEEIAAAALAKENAEKKREQEVKINYTDEQIEAAIARAKEFLGSVFAAMNMKVEINADFDKNENVLMLDFAGDDMGVLIGKRGQTLDSFQYLASLIVNKDIEGYIHVKADTENYRERRKKTLENLAKNIAFKVKKTRRSVALEPMNPYERRIIHSALQNDKYVTTYSEGEDPYRKVVVTLKK